MPTIDLDDKELNEIMDHMANNMVWSKANPLLMKISQQIQQQMKPQRPQSDGAGETPIPPIPPAPPSREEKASRRQQ